MESNFADERAQFDPLMIPVKVRKSSNDAPSRHFSFDRNLNDNGFDVAEQRPLSANSNGRTNSARMPSSLEDFEILTTIGSGSYGTCKKIRSKKDGKILAWKEMDYGSMTESEKQMLVSEVNLLRELRHQNIVRYYDRIIDRNKTTLYIIMEFCDGGDLASLISNCRRESSYVDEEFVWKIFIQMTQALKECHRRRNGRAVLHRDLKPANIFLDSNENVKLGDFGLARVLQHETSFAKTYVGTPYYMSPELVNNMSYNEKSDIWSMGCLLYELCALHPPFTATNQHDLNRKIRNGEFKRIPLRYSESLNLVVSKLLRVEVQQRPSIDDVLNDPIVLRKKSRLEKRDSDRSETETGTKSPTSLQKWEDELKMREKQFKAKQKEMEEYYAQKEKQLSLREKLAEDKLRRAEILIREYGRKGSIDRDVKSSGDAVTDSEVDCPVLIVGNWKSEEDLSADSLLSCLSKGKRDTPKKKVTFDVYGKENLRHREKYGYLPSYTDQDNYNDMYLQELAKRQELKDRLFKAKARAFEFHGIDDDIKPKTNNLLYFR